VDRIDLSNFPNRESDSNIGKRRSRAETRTLLLDAAARLVSERGLERVNSNRIARAAGVGVGTFYALFEDKHILFQELVLSVLEDLGNRLRERVGSGGDPADEIRGWVETVVAFAEENPHRFRAAFAREPAAAGGRPGVGYSARGVERRLRDLQRQGLVASSLHPGVAAKAFACMQAGVVSWWLEDPRRAPREAVIETLVRMHPASLPD
jgi:AcrR family transcriptional regulator